MPQSSDTQASLASYVRWAFDDVPYPGDMNIVYDNSDYYPDVAETAEGFRGKDWRDMDASFLSNEYCESLLDLTPKAVQYYLPAYLLVSLESYEDADIVTDYTYYFLCPCKGATTDFRERFKYFNERQIVAVARFLRYMTETHWSDWFDFGRGRLQRCLTFWEGEARKRRTSD